MVQVTSGEGHRRGSDSKDLGEGRLGRTGLNGGGESVR